MIAISGKGAEGMRLWYNIRAIWQLNMAAFI